MTKSRSVKKPLTQGPTPEQRYTNMVKDHPENLSLEDQSLIRVYLTQVSSTGSSSLGLVTYTDVPTYEALRGYVLGKYGTCHPHTVYFDVRLRGTRIAVGPIDF